MPRRKSPSKEASETIAAGGFFMVRISSTSLYVITPVASSPPAPARADARFGHVVGRGGGASFWGGA